MIDPNSYCATESTAAAAARGQLVLLVIYSKAGPPTHPQPLPGTLIS